MKKIIFVILPFLLLIGLRSGFAGLKYQQETPKVAGSIPDEVRGIFQHSCFDCHSKGGKRMAMSKVNFSEWDNYSQDKKIKKSADIVKMLNKGAMPPKIYRQQHPDKIPTPDQLDMIKKWADSLSVK